MKVGIFGTNFGAFHASIYKKQQYVETFRIWGRNRERLDTIGKEMDIETTDDINDLLCDQSIGLIDVCLPTSMHNEYIIRALESGKNVFCETPLCSDIGDINSILDAEKKSGKRLYVDQFIKFIQEYRFIKEAVDDERYGKLLVLKAWRNTAPVWGKLGNDSIVTSLMIHELDFATWLLGFPTNLEAKAKAKNEGETFVEAVLSYSDAVVSLSVSSMLPLGYPFTTGYIAMFEKGAVHASCFFENDNPKRTVVEFANGVMRSIELPLTNPYESAIAHVLDCCQTGEASCISGESAAMAAKVAIEITSLIH